MEPHDSHGLERQLEDETGEDGPRKPEEAQADRGRSATKVWSPADAGPVANARNTMTQGLTDRGVLRKCTREEVPGWGGPRRLSSSPSLG